MKPSTSIFANSNTFQQSYGQQHSPSQQQSQGLLPGNNSVSQMKLMRLQAQQQQAQGAGGKNAEIQRQIEVRKVQGPEFCSRHGEPNVGFLDNTREVVCNTCIFEKKLTAVKFTALVSKELRNEFNSAFAHYRNGLNSISGVEANLVKQRAEILVQKFFAQIREKVKLLQRQSMSKIQQSESLRELERIIEQSREFLPDQAKSGDHFEREKRLFDEKIGKGRFAYLVKRQEFYQDLISSLDKSSEKIKQTIEKSSETMERVLQMRQDDNLVRHSLNQIVSDCIDVDMSGMRPKRSSPSNTTTAFLQHPNSTTQSSHMLFSPKNSDSGSNQARGSSNYNSSMQRNSVPCLNSDQITPLLKQNLQQFSGQQVATEQVSERTSFTFGQQHATSQVRQKSPVMQQTNFSPIPNHSELANAQTPPQSVVDKQDSVSVAQVDIASRASLDNASQNSDDCVIVTSVVPPTQPVGPNMLEHSFKSTFKLKGQILLKLIPGRGWVKIREMTNLMLAKTVQTLDEAAFVLGGAQDRNSTQTFTEVQMFQVRNGAVHSEQKAPMQLSRSSHGCTVNVQKNEIYVAGGYHNGELTRSCEAYSVQQNIWKQLPPLNEPKCSVTLCTLNGRYLYSFGGLTKQESGAFLLGSIEVIDLEAPQPKWLMLSVKMPHQVCDIGAIPINETDILLYGGWNKSPVNSAFIIKQTIRANSHVHSFHPVNVQMDKSDFSMISGVAMKTVNPEVIKVCCHAFLFSFNLKINAFVGSSSM